MKDIKDVNDLYDEIQDSLVNTIGREPEFENIWNEINKLDDELKQTLAGPEYSIFDDYLSKESELIDLERKKAFSYGYKLANKLMVESLR